MSHYELVWFNCCHFLCTFAKYNLLSLFVLKKLQILEQDEVEKFVDEIEKEKEAEAERKKQKKTGGTPSK